MRFVVGELIFVKSLPAGQKKNRLKAGPANIVNVNWPPGYYGVQFVGDDSFIYQAGEKHVRLLKRSEARVVTFIRNVKSSSNQENAKISCKLSRI